MRLTTHFKRRLIGNGVTRLVETALGREDEPSHDQALRCGSRLRQPALDQRHIQPRLGHAA
jgi:hypothetical protein